MKINITVGSSHVMNGYLNIDPITGQDIEEAQIIRADIRNLDSVAMDSESREIIAVVWGLKFCQKGSMA